MKRGEIWSISLDPTIGSEINKTRPAVIVSRDSLGKLPLKIIVPITGWQDRFAQSLWHIPLNPSAQNGLSKKSTADTFQVRSVSEKRLIKKLGVLDSNIMNAISQGLAISLDIS